MRVVIKTLAGDSCSVAARESDSAAGLLAGAAAAIGDGVDVHASSLVFLGRVLNDADTLGDAGLQEGSVLILARRRVRRSVVEAAAAPAAAAAAATGGKRVSLKIKQVGTEAAATSISVGHGAALSTVVQQLKAEWGVGAVRLVHGGRVLHPGVTVSEAGLADGMTLFGMASAAAVAPAAAALAAAAVNSDSDHEPAGGRRPEGPRQGESEETMCRICHCGQEMAAELGPLFSPCLCAGTMQHVHVECLNRWRRMSDNPTSYFACDSCGYRYQMNRTRWAGYVESRAATEVATALMCVLMVCSAAFPCYYFELHTHFVRIRPYQPPPWPASSHSQCSCCVCGCGRSICSVRWTRTGDRRHGSPH